MNNCTVLLYIFDQMKAAIVSIKDKKHILKKIMPKLSFEVKKKAKEHKS